jgi:2-amino-4-hydroxy-6-hydroxymethyldihydropteridine diphosphokinase
MPGIIIALGGNLPSSAGTPPQTFAAACDALRDRGLVIVRKARLYCSKPVPASDQPDYYNTCIEAYATLPAIGMMAALHQVEKAFGRERRAVNEARTLDLDLIDYEGRVSDERSGALVLPHPRMTDRGFVLKPMADLVPAWRHPRTGERLSTLLARLPNADDARAVFDPAWVAA